jgi:hypothetical protein
VRGVGWRDAPDGLLPEEVHPHPHPHPNPDTNTDPNTHPSPSPSLSPSPNPSPNLSPSPSPSPNQAMSEADWVQLRTFRSLVGQQAPLCSLVITPCDSQPPAASCPTPNTAAS